MKPSIVHQQGASDCGVACLLTVVRYFGGNQSLEYLRELSGTTTQGTTLLGLVQACPVIGLTGKGLRTKLAYLRQIKTPVILPVLIDERLQHYVVCFPKKSDKNVSTFTIGDPAKGNLMEYTEAELEKIWQSKAVLEAVPNEDFVTQKDLNKAKRVWFWELLKNDIELLLISSIIGVLLSILGMANAIFYQKLIDEILPKTQYIKLFTGLFLLTFLLLARVGLNFLRGQILLKQSRAFNQRLIDKFYSSLLYLPKHFFDNKKIGELTARMNDTRKIQTNISYLTSNVIMDFLMIIISIIFISSYSIWVALLVVLSIPAYIVLVYLFHTSILQSQQQVMESYAHNESNYIDTIQGIAVIKNLGKETLFTQKTHLIYQHFQNNVLRVGKVGLRFQAWGDMIGILLIASVFALICGQVLLHELPIGAMTALLAMCAAMLPSVARLAMTNLQMQEARIAFDRMFDFVSIKPENTTEAGKEWAEVEKIEQLHIKDLSFRFAGRKQLFKDVNFTLQRGKIVALLGESGSGKSTILQILQRFYLPENGTIEVNGKDWQNFPLVAWRKGLFLKKSRFSMAHSWKTFGFSDNFCGNACSGGL